MSMQFLLKKLLIISFLINVTFFSCLQAENKSGSIRDDEVIAAANEAGIAMVFTGIRHFRH